MKTAFLSIILLGTIISNGQAKLLQILHTNDVHGQLERAGVQSENGGYANIKAMVNTLRRQGHEKGMSTLFLDAGDFLEGNLLYSAREGVDIMNILEAMDYDAVVIGNHDWQMGTHGLDKLLGEVTPNFPILGANFKVMPYFTNIRKHIKPFKEFVFDNKKIAVLGLTTNSRLYKWMVKEGTITKPLKSAEFFERRLKDNLQNDIIIALTHLGQDADIELAQNTSGIDVIVGGHSHSELHEPLMIKNKRGHLVPIVQTGSWGKYLGRLILDISDNNQVKVVSYQLLPVTSTHKDLQIAQLVYEARQNLYEKYGIDYLKEPLAQTEVPLLRGEYRRTLWGDIVADAFRDALKADVSLHVPSMAGDNILAGEITREEMMQSYPRFFELENKDGWHIYNSTVHGWVLKLALTIMVNSGYPLYFSGVKFKYKKSLLGKYYVYDVVVNGKKLKHFRSYDFVIPEGVARGGLGISSLITWVLRQMSKTSITVWEALEIKLKELQVIKKDYYEYYSRLKGKSRASEISRTMVPQHSSLD